MARTLPWRTGTLNARTRSVRIVPDALAGGVALAVALVLAWPLLSARDFETGAGDWPAHVFRVREVLDHGFESWSHTWAGGMPLWEGYQALPHAITAGLIRLTGISTPRGMVVLAGVMTVVLRVGVYALGRWLGAPPLAALAGALAAIWFDSARQATANFTEVWGLALAPLVLAAAFRWAGKPGGFIVAALVGLSIEVHPLLAVIGGLAMTAAFAASPGGRSWRLLAGQAIVAMIGAAVFWLPVLLSARPAYAEPYYESVQFARLLWRLTIAGFAPGWPVAAGAVLLIALCVPGVRASSAVRFLTLLWAGVALMAGVSVASWAPDAVRGGQLARMAGLTPVLVGALVALIVSRLDRVIGSKWAAAVCLTLASAAIVRGHGALDAGVAGGADPLTVVSESDDVATTGRIYADPVLTARASLRLGRAVRFAGSYSGREWSILHGPLEFFLSGNGSPEARRAYLIAHGVDALILPVGARPVLPEDSGEWRPTAAADGFELIRAPWSAPPAWLLPVDQRDGLTAPDSAYRDLSSAYVRDTVAGRFAAASRVADAAQVTYPDGETIVVDVRGLTPGQLLVVNENWDRAWTASIDGRQLRVERFGLNQIAVDLDDLSGDVRVTLRHDWPRAAWAGLILSLLAVPVAGAATRLTRQDWYEDRHLEAHYEARNPLDDGDPGGR